MYGWKKLSIQQKCSWNTVRQEPFSKLLYCANYYVLPCVEKSLQSTDMLDCFRGLQMLRHKNMYVSYTKHLCLHVLQIFSCACCLHLTNAAWYGGDVMHRVVTVDGLENNENKNHWHMFRTDTTALFLHSFDWQLNESMDEGRLKHRGLTVLIHVLDSNCKPGNFSP